MGRANGSRERAPDHRLRETHRFACDRCDPDQATPTINPAPHHVHLMGIASLHPSYELPALPVCARHVLLESVMPYVKLSGREMAPRFAMNAVAFERHGEQKLNRLGRPSLAARNPPASLIPARD
jgi:hypothetical protein